MKPLTAGALGALMAMLGTGSVQAQSPAERPTFRSAVDLVSVAAVVKDKHGRFVRDLSADDFVVLDRGEPRRIVDFTAGSSAAVTLAFLMDESGSMGVGPGLDQARQSVDRFLSVVGESGGGQDSVALFGFDSRVRKLHPFSGDVESVRAALARVEPYGATSIYDAIADTAGFVAARGRVRRAVVVITDGMDTYSHLTLEEASGLASAIDVPVYVIEVGRSAEEAKRFKRLRPAADESSATLVDLARWTGGDFVQVSDAPLDMKLAAARILADVRYQYLLAFESAPQAGWRALEVRTRDTTHTVRARGAYMAGERRPEPAGPRLDLPPAPFTRNGPRANRK